MIELVAACAGALVTVCGVTVGSAFRRSGESRDVIVKLSMGVEHIGSELQALREDMKEDRHEIFSRLGKIEQRISSIEAVQKSEKQWVD